MPTSFDSVTELSEQELLNHFARLVVRDRRTTAELLVAIAEIDERKLWATHACSSMFTFCMERFHMSEHVTAKRLWAARTARRFPVIVEMVARGELHLSAIHLLAKHLTGQNHEWVLERAKHKSSREVERLVAELAPRPDVPSRIRALPVPRGGGLAVDGPAVAALNVGASSDEDSTNIDPASGAGPKIDGSALLALVGGASGDEHSTPSDAAGGPRDRLVPADGDQTVGVHKACFPRASESRTAAKLIAPLSPRRFKIEITVDEETHDKLRSLQDLLARSGTGRDPAAIVSRAIDVLLDRTLARKAACTERSKSTTPATPSMSTTPAARGNAATPTTPETPRTPTPSAIPMKSVVPTNAEKPTRPELRGHTTPALDIETVTRGQRSRSIPAAVRREVWGRDSGRCRYLDGRGHRCGETSNVEFHHKTPFALGGPHEPDNIEMRCAAHNQFQADLDFGRSFMNAKRCRVAAARTFPRECWR